jgi:hypothetical protein
VPNSRDPRQGGRHRTLTLPEIQALSPEELDGELLAAGIEPESLRRIARQVFAQFGIEDAPSSQGGGAGEGE